MVDAHHPTSRLVDTLVYTGTSTNQPPTNHRSIDIMTRIIAILALTILTLLPAPRCHVERSSGRYWLVCPCRSVTYQCDDWYRVPRYRGGR